MKKIKTNLIKLAVVLFSSIVFLCISQKTFAQEFTENKYKAKIISVKYEEIEDQTFTQYELEIINTDRKGDIINVQINPDDKSIEIKDYAVGQKVVVLSTETEEFQTYFIIDHIRTNAILTLTIVFIILTILIGKKLGLQSLIGLGLTTVILLLVIIPSIERGDNILLVSSIGSCLIAIISIYLSHGFKRKSTMALIGTLISIALTFILSILFTNLFKLTGFSSEESMYLLGFEGLEINMKNLLISSLIFGGIGILDDVTVSQVSVVNEILEIDNQLDSVKLYQKAMNVGKDHISSMVNTLFLAYASSSLPLIILLKIQNASVLEIINNEIIAEEILRTLVGSIGLILAVPITTALAVYFYKRNSTKS